MFNYYQYKPKFTQERLNECRSSIARFAKLNIKQFYNYYPLDGFIARQLGRYCGQIEWHQDHNVSTPELDEIYTNLVICAVELPDELWQVYIETIKYTKKYVHRSYQDN